MGKNVLIIGASGDIGSAIALELGQSGYQLLLHYNQNRETINRIREKLDTECILTEIKADLRNDAEIKNLLNNIVFQVDYIVFASGNAHFGLFQNTPDYVMEDMLSLHVKAPWMISKHLLPDMIQHKRGKILFITSIWGEIGSSNEVIYSALKGAQNSFVKALAKEIGPCGITVNAISPGYIETKMNHHLTEEERQAVISEIPLNRAGTPEEIAHTAAFLLDDRSNYINGEIIRINGGW